MKLQTSQSLFLEKLADLCTKHNAGFYYTIDDDGIHIEVDGKECFVGHAYMPQHFASQLREHSKKC